MIVHKVTTISRSPIAGDESQQLAILHRLIKFQKKFNNYHGDNCRVEEMIENRLKRLVRAQRMDLSPSIITLGSVNKVHRINLMFINGAMTNSMQRVPDVWSLVLSHTRTQYRVVGCMDGATLFNGITLRLDSVLWASFYICLGRAWVVVLVHGGGDMSFRLDSHEEAAKLVSDIKLLARL